jgi:hypothetical protein
LIRHLLQNQLEEDAVVFARAYERLVYFGHALEILLHTVLEEEAEKSTPVDQGKERVVYVYCLTVHQLSSLS